MALQTTILARNLSRLEKGLALLIVAVLFALFMRRMDSVSVAAERTLLVAELQDMQARLMTLRTEFVLGKRALPLTLDEVVRGIGRGDILFADSARQFDWARVAAGSWVYFREQRQLVYRVMNDGDFAVAEHAPDRVRFQVAPRFADTNGNGRFDAAVERLNGAALVPLDGAALSPSQ